MMNITVSGIDTAKDGRFLVIESGDISFDTTVMADIWLVGGGMDGGDGYIDERGIFHGGFIPGPFRSPTQQRMF